MWQLSINSLVMFSILIVDFLHGQSPCDIVTLKYGNVCRCTENYCDRIVPLGTIPDKQAAFYESTSEHAATHRLTRLNNLQFQSEVNPNITNLLQIDYAITYQTILGFWWSIYRFIRDRCSAIIGEFTRDFITAIFW